MLRTARLLWYWSGVAIGLVGLCAILPRGGVDVTLLGYTLTPEMQVEPPTESSSMDDIVEKLRDYGLTLEESIIICDRRAVDEAADLIETLQQKASDLEADYLRRHNDAVDRYERIIVLEADNARLAKELEEARKALGPFAECAPEWDGEPDSLHVFLEWNDENQPVPSIPVADFRRAAAIRHKATVTTDDLPEGGSGT